MTPPSKEIQPNVSGKCAGGATTSGMDISVVFLDGSPVKWPSKAITGFNCAWKFTE